MSSTKRNTLFFLLMFVSFNGLGQLGYLGSRLGVEVGVGTNFALLNNTGDFYNYQVDNDILLPKINLGLLLETKKGSMIHFRGVYNQLPNSRINSLFESQQGADLTVLTDTAWTKSDNFQLGLGFRRYKELAPLGVYFDFDLRGNVVFNKTLYSSTTLENLLDYNISQMRTENSILSKVSLIPEIGFSVGGTFPLNEAVLLDFGGKLSFALGRLQDRKEDPNKIPEPDVFHRIVGAKKVVATNLLEVYVNFVLFP